MRGRRARVAARKILPAASTRDPFDDVNVREDVRRHAAAHLASSADRDRAHGHLGYSSDQAARIMSIQLHGWPFRCQ